MNELILVENALISYIVLKTTCLLTKEKGKFLILSAFLSGCFAFILPKLNLNNIGQFLCTCGIAIVCICISFKFKTIKKFIKLLAIYYLANFIYGGACFFITNLITIKSFLIILCCIIAVFLIVNFIARNLYKKASVEKFCFDVEIENFGKKGKWKAFLDSGNLLKDPITDSPVSLINYKVFSKLFNDISLEDLLKGKIDKLKYAHYINLNTLNGSDKILAFQVDRLVIGERSLNSVMLGLCFNNFKDAFGSDIILNNSLAT